MSVSFKPQIQDILIKEILDVDGKKGKVSNDIIRHVIGDNQNTGGGMGMDLLPSQEESKEGLARGQLTAGQLKNCRAAARKILIAFGGQMSEILQKADPQSVGMLQSEKVKGMIEEKNVPDLQPSELSFLMSYCDQNNFGFFVIPNFCSKLSELASETEAEVKLRRFAKSIGHQGLNLKSELSQYDTTRSGKLDSVQFKRVMKQLSIAMTDQEIKELFDTGDSQRGPKGHLDIASFCQQVQAASKAKPLPSFLTTAPAKSGSKV